jgi:hypothetical protein
VARVLRVRVVFFVGGGESCEAFAEVSEAGGQGGRPAAGAGCGGGGLAGGRVVGDGG